MILNSSIYHENGGLRRFETKNNLAQYSYTIEDFFSIIQNLLDQKCYFFVYKKN